MPPRSKKNHKAEKSRSGQFRIIGGQWRSRRCSFPELEGLRPTTDRVRETLFNWLQFDLPGAAVLDAFAGSGALGFEALSRGAEKVWMLEQNASACLSLKGNAVSLNANAEIIQTNALEWINRCEQQFDLVFIDPPFRKGILAEFLEKLESADCLKPGAKIYLEQEKELQAQLVPEGWQPLKEKVAGQVAYRLYTRASE